MIVSHRLKFVFLGIPRTASRAMHAALKELPGARQPWGGLHRMTIPANARDYFTFCCVRNPYQRLYSHYCCCWGKRRRWWAGRVRVRSFAEYLDVLAAGLSRLLPANAATTFVTQNRTGGTTRQESSR
jgi:hypothetical protein